MEPSLPKVAAAAMETIDVLCIAKVCPADGLGQRILGVGYRHDMDMVAHQAIADQLPGHIYPPALSTTPDIPAGHRRRRTRRGGCCHAV